MDANTLLADPAVIAIEKFVPRADAITVVVRSTRPTARCPLCDQPSSSLKTHYLRRVADLPWHGVAVRLELQTRKFRCRNALCPRKVFCERLPSVVAPYSRRTARLSRAVELLAFALGARAAARATTSLAIPVGKDICLRVMRRTPVDIERRDLHALGVDDFAFRRGCTYGTILVDLERREPVDLLPDRTAETLTAWLKERPGLEVISRDRSSAYAEAARAGAPQAAQVADRWHLLKNLGDLVERFLTRRHDLLTGAAALVRARHAAQLAEVELPAGAKADGDVRAERPVPARRRQLFEAIKELQSRGRSVRRIARELKVARNTVRRYVVCDSPPPQGKGAGRPSSVQAFAAFLKRRWRDGEHNAFCLWQEIKAQGFAGGMSRVGNEPVNAARTEEQELHCKLFATLTPHHCHCGVELNPDFL